MQFITPNGIISAYGAEADAYIASGEFQVYEAPAAEVPAAPAPRKDVKTNG